MRDIRAFAGSRVRPDQAMGTLMALTLQEFFEAVGKDEALLRAGRAPAGVAKCECCGVPLQESITGNRDGLCSDCYFEDFGEELDAHPISALRVSRGA